MSSRGRSDHEMEDSSEIQRREEAHESDPLVYSPAPYSSKQKSVSAHNGWRSCCCSVIRYVAILLSLFLLAFLSLLFFLLLLNSSSTLSSSIESVSETAAKIGSRLGLRTETFAQEGPGSVPTLVVQVTIDQLRTDEVMKFRRKYRTGADWKGWNYLFREGVFYRNAHYRHATTLTPAGHAALFTGGTGFSHGIIALHFRPDPLKDEIVFCVADPRYHETERKEPTPIEGTAPTWLMSTTTGDELRLFTNSSRVYSVSQKDYVAILQGGHLGKSFWFSTQTGRYISSTFYYNTSYPEWVSSWNEKKVAESYRDKFWDLSLPISQYHFQDRQYVNPGYLGTAFPKPLHNDDLKAFFKGLLETPDGDRVQLDFVQNLVTEEQLGKNDQVVDFLAVSFSGNDKIGHQNGPNSIEKEDNLYKLDVLLHDLISFLHSHLGDPAKLLLAISSDHGVDLAWKHNRDIGFQDAEQFSGDIILPAANAMLNSTYGGTLTSDLILDFASPNLYLSYENVKANNKEREEVEDLVAGFLLSEYPQVAYAFTRTKMLENAIPRNPIVDRIQNTFHPKRSGDVLVVQSEHVWMSSSASSAVAMHGSPWSYDSYVPIFFVGKDIPKGEIVDRRVGPEDVAVTMASYFGLKSPTGSIGDPLTEVLRLRDVFPPV